MPTTLRIPSHSFLSSPIAACTVLAPTSLASVDVCGAAQRYDSFRLSYERITLPCFGRCARCWRELCVRPTCSDLRLEKRPPPSLPPTPLTRPSPQLRPPPPSRLESLLDVLRLLLEMLPSPSLPPSPLPLPLPLPLPPPPSRLSCLLLAPSPPQPLWILTCPRESVPSSEDAELRPLPACTLVRRLGESVLHWTGGLC